MGHGRTVHTLVVGQLDPGDCVVLKTTNSTYRFWVEFPAEAVGVMSGGNLAGPTRVRLSAEGVDVSQASTLPISVGGRAHSTVLSPTGVPLRSIVTSTISSITVVPVRSVAA